MIRNEESLIITYDNEDHVKRRDFNKSLTGAGIFVTVITAVDMRLLRSMKAARNMGPVKKLVFLNILNAPFYYYFYNDISNKYLELKKHLVTKYLIIGDELMYKKK